MSDTTADDFLEHFGVKGMKWGKRKGSSDSGDSGGSGGKSEKKAKPTSDDIKAARKRQQDRERDYEEAAAEYMVARTNKGAQKAERIMRNKEFELYTNPDAATAAKLTKGEKIASGVILGAYGLVAAGLVVGSAR